MNFGKFVPLTKMEERPEGVLRVFGLVTAEQPDLENEVLDYAGTKPYYQAKVDKTAKTTAAVDGMEVSIMPLREMHQLVAIGAGRTIEFDDAAKTIHMGFDVVDPVAQTKFRKGVLIGFSHGGSYVGPLVPDPVHKGCKRYVCDPVEVSAVDSPCLPQALVQSMKGQTVQLQKADGVIEEVPLEIKPLEEARLISLERGLADILELLKREKVAQTPKRDTIAVEKSGGIMAKMTTETVAKAAKTMADHLEKLSEMHKAHGEHMKKAHEAIETKHEALGEHIEKCMKCAKEMGEGEEPTEKVAPVVADAKLAALEASVAALVKANKELSELVKKQPAPILVKTGATNETRSGDVDELLKGTVIERVA